MKDFRKIWKTMEHRTARDHFHYCILKAMNAKSNKDKVQIASAILQKAFTPTTNAVKLANGRDTWSGIWDAGLGWTTIPDACETDEEKAEYTRIVKELKLYFMSNRGQLPDTPYHYVFVRQDISIEQQMVQAGHACTEVGYAIREAGESIENLHMCLIGVLNVEELAKAQTVLTRNDIKHVAFFEPDMDNQMTAIATYPIGHRKRRFLRGFKRLRA